eukprot:UN04441
MYLLESSCQIHCKRSDFVLFNPSFLFDIIMGTTGRIFSKHTVEAIVWYVMFDDQTKTWLNPGTVRQKTIINDVGYVQLQRTGGRLNRSNKQEITVNPKVEDTIRRATKTSVYQIHPNIIKMNVSKTDCTMLFSADELDAKGMDDKP